MESIAEEPSTDGSIALATAAQSGANGHGALDTLTSGHRRELRGGALQAHICVVTAAADVGSVMAAFQSADAFKHVTSWSYAYRIRAVRQPGTVDQFLHNEGTEDGLDEGCGERILQVLKRHNLDGLLLVVSRWQDFGATPGLELFGTVLYGIVKERCKDLILHLKAAMGLGDTSVQSQPLAVAADPWDQMKSKASRPPVLKMQKPRGYQSFDFSFLPRLVEPKEHSKMTPNHFMADGPTMKKTSSLPSLMNGVGGDVRLWMRNDQCLQELSEQDLQTLRTLRLPDERIERVLHAVATLRGQKLAKTGSATGRWGQCLQLLRSQTFRTELLLTDVSQITVEAAQQADFLLQGLEAASLQRTSPAAGILCDWARGLVRWRLDGPPAEDDGGLEQSEMVPVEALQPRIASPAGLMRSSRSGPIRVGFNRPSRSISRRAHGPPQGLVAAR
eukprot:TRINITY_DN7909_c0_g1_i1.p1 TRINITY_DN7909_c0_g1~~TRINITY_DN7909_c0_g1_i1.p1  ORF type:complete len:447 (-),score=75.59 TRINITY_DN7909_c0_g1_i1:90-1430(-)